MVIDNGYVVLDVSRNAYQSPKGRPLYKTKKTAEKGLEIMSRLWGKKNLRVVKVKIVIDEQED